MKTITVLALFLFVSGNIFSQNFIRIKNDIDINGTKFLRGEIYKLVKDGKILFGHDTITIDIKSIEPVFEIDNINSNRLVDSLKKTGDNKYQINISSLLYNKDTIKLINSFNEVVVFFGKKDSLIISLDGTVYKYRLVVPSCPSIVLGNYKAPEIYNSGDDKEGFFQELKWWYYIVASIVILGLIGLLYWLKIKKGMFVKKTKTIPIYSNYTEGSFGDFAKKSKITRKTLFKLNNKLLREYKNLKYEKQKENFKNELRGTDLIIGYTSNYSEASSDSDIKTYKSPDNQDIKETSQSKQFFNNEIAVLFQTMERNIISRIDSFSSNRQAAQTVEILKKQNESLKVKINQSEKEKDMMTAERDTFHSELNNIKKEKQQIEIEYNRYREKVIFVDFLEAYARIVRDYFKLAKSGYNEALELYKGIHEADDKSSLIVGQLIVKFQSNLPSKIGNWEEIVNEIIENKATSNSELIRSFKQIQSNEEKLKEFKRILFKEIIENYSSSILILTEELTKLSKFTNTTTSIIQEYEKYFSNFTNQLHGKLSIMGLDLKFVTLFDNYERFAAHTKLTNQNCSPPYKQVKGLEKDAVLEVVSYGFGNEETKVILV